MLDSNDNPPVFTASSYTFSIAEGGGKAELIGTVAASDQDTADNGRISFRFKSASDTFTIERQSGRSIRWSVTGSTIDPSNVLSLFQ